MLSLLQTNTDRDSGSDRGCLLLMTVEKTTVDAEGQGTPELKRTNCYPPTLCLTFLPSHTQGNHHIQIVK